MVRAPESQSLLVPIPLGHTKNIPQCPSFGNRARIPVLIGPNTIGTTEKILECPSYGKEARIPVLIGPNTIGAY